MKYFILIIAICGLNALAAQDVNIEIATEGEKPFLLGKINREGLTGANYNLWFDENYEKYNLDKKVIEQIGTKLNDYSIKLFMGTWCGDSKREVPRFYKILEACNFPKNQLSAIALGRKRNMYKKSPNHEESGLNIHRVPTFIFYKNGKEINRIVETPVESLEKDILNIITSNNYKSNYQIVTEIDHILKHNGLNGLEKQHKKLLKAYKNKLESMFELNTYASVLFTENKYEAATLVFKLNNKLFPEEPRTYMSLANTLGFQKKKAEAIAVLEKAVALFPDNKDLAENLETIKTY
ncbi:MAG: hypothetical protein ACON5F_01525 [Jejuia sp.]